MERLTKVRIALLVLFLILVWYCFLFGAQKQDIMEDYFLWQQEYDTTKDVGITKEYGEYPRLLNNFDVGNHLLDTMWVVGTDTLNIRDSVAKALSKWDAVKASLTNQVTRNGIYGKVLFHRKIKQFNPNTKVLLYLTLGQHPYRAAPHIIKQFVAKTMRENDWFIPSVKDTVFPSIEMVPIPNYRIPGCASFVCTLAESLLNFGGCYDGLWIDLVRGDYVLRKWIKEGREPDLNRNSISDALEWGLDATVDSLKVNYVILLDSLRQRLGPEVLLLCNPGVPWGTERSDSTLSRSANGNMIEGNYNVESWVNWGAPGAIRDGVLADSIPERFTRMCYSHLAKYCGGRMENAQEFRYTFVSALLTPAYFAYDPRDTSIYCKDKRYHSSLWWWPEYNINLGKAESGLLDKRDSGHRKYYSREFERGTVVLNRNDHFIRIRFPDKRKDITTGKVDKYFIVPEKDGRIFLRVGAKKRWFEFWK